MLLLLLLYCRCYCFLQVFFPSAASETQRKCVPNDSGSSSEAVQKLLLIPGSQSLPFVKPWLLGKMHFFLSCAFDMMKSVIGAH